jgi:hypothetical protein
MPYIALATEGATPQRKLKWLRMAGPPFAERSEYEGCRQ